MNRLQKKTWLMAIGISIGLILSGIIIEVLSSKLEFSKAWIRVGDILCMAGSFGVASMIIFYRNSIIKPKKYYTVQLKSKAWSELWKCFFLLILGTASFCFLLQYNNADNPFTNDFFVVIGIVSGIHVVVERFIMKKRLLQELDERERLIYERAMMISDSIFGGLCVMGFFGLWGWFGPKTPILIYVPVLMLLGFSLIAWIAQSLIILIQCKMESVDE